MTTATVKQAIEIIKMNGFRYPVEAIAEYLQDSGIDTVLAYHVTKDENVEAIRADGIKATGCYSRQDSAYIFLDYRDVRDNGENVTGAAEFTVFTVAIPAEFAATIKDDGLYNGTFSTSYSASRLEMSIPTSWIINEAIETDSHR
jgi:hypothetical protein